MELIINSHCNINCFLNLNITNNVPDIILPSGGPWSDSDFTFSGYYLLDNDLGNGIAFCGHLTHHWVGDELRFITMARNDGSNDLIGFRLPPGEANGQEITSDYRTNIWPGEDVWQEPGVPLTPENHVGIWWEDLPGGDNRLWGTFGIAYPGDVTGGTLKGITQAVTVRKLLPDNTVSDFEGVWGFEGVSQRCVSGKVQKNPQWFQEDYSVGPYLYGMGGYSSLQVAGGLISLGLFALAGPDVTTYPVGDIAYATGVVLDSNIPDTDFKILADHRSGIQHDDEDSTVPPAWDRGHRLTNPKNFYEATNPDMPPNGPGPEQEEYYETHDPLPDSGWLSPASDGVGRWVWGDAYFNTGCWVDGDLKQGLVCVASLSNGWVGYVNSSLQGEFGAAEIHVFDPEHLGEVANNTRDPWNVQPIAMKNITPQLDSLGLGMYPRGEEQGGPVGATYVPEEKKLYILFTSTDFAYQCALLCYDVNC